MKNLPTMVAELTPSPAGAEVKISVPGEVRAVVRWHANSALPPGAADLLLPLALLPAMRIGAHLRILAEVSAQQIENAERVQRLYRSWDRSLCRVDVDVERTVRRETRSVADAAFFSGGIDSFYTALRHRSTLRSLIFVAGFDIGHHRRKLLDRVLSANRQVAAGLGLELVEVSTDLREFSAAYLSWSEYHGAALAAAAHLCGFARTHVPGSLSVDSTFAYGSHPDLDPLWSSESSALCYDAYETNRVAKTAEIAGSKLALQYLRVCNSRDDGGYNCGRCEKCLRTMAALRIAGRRGRLPTFPHELNTVELAGRRFRQAHDLWRQNLRAAVACGDTELADAIASALSSRRRAAPTAAG